MGFKRFSVASLDKEEALTEEEEAKYTKYFQKFDKDKVCAACCVFVVFLRALRAVAERSGAAVRSMVFSLLLAIGASDQRQTHLTRRNCRAETLM